MILCFYLIAYVVGIVCTAYLVAMTGKVFLRKVLNDLQLDKYVNGEHAIAMLIVLSWLGFALLVVLLDRWDNDQRNKYQN